MSHIDIRRDLKAAYSRAWPVMIAYVFMAIAFGLSLNQAGFNVVWAGVISVIVYAGSLQFALVGFLAAGTAVTTAAVLALLLNARHMFYGISFIERFRKNKKAYPYMIFSLTDETYSVLLADTWPEGVNEARADFFLALMNHLSWILGSVIGALAGALIPLDFAGVEFSMTALFMIIFLNQWKEQKQHFPAICGLVSAAVFLAILGPDHFILPSLIVSVLIILIFQAIPQSLNPNSGKGGDPHADHI